MANYLYISLYSLNFVEMIYTLVSILYSPILG